MKVLQVTNEQDRFQRDRGGAARQTAHNLSTSACARRRMSLFRDEG